PGRRRNAVKSLPVALAIAATSATGALAACSNATAPTLDRPAYTRELQKLADGRSGAVAVVVTPEGTWKGAVGWADSQAQRRADPADRLAVGHPGKPVGATVGLELVGERRLELHDTADRGPAGLVPAPPGGPDRAAGDPRRR